VISEKFLCAMIYASLVRAKTDAVFRRFGRQANLIPVWPYSKVNWARRATIEMCARTPEKRTSYETSRQELKAEI
jgi:hypothetical protein